MGFEVVAIGRGADKRSLAKQLGAHHYLDNGSINVAEALQKLGGASLVVATASAGKAVADTIKGLRPGGHVITLGATPDPIELVSYDLIFGNRSVDGSLTGNPATGDMTLKFSSLTGTAAMIEKFPLERAAEGYARMMSGQARFRVVLTMSA
jgi:propanol-preferring alcohol dehydrogenase